MNICCPISTGFTIYTLSSALEGDISEAFPGVVLLAPLPSFFFPLVNSIRASTYPSWILLYMPTFPFWLFHFMVPSDLNDYPPALVNTQTQWSCIFLIFSFVYVCNFFFSLLFLLFFSFIFLFFSFFFLFLAVLPKASQMTTSSNL